jgi:hypothetical protein
MDILEPHPGELKLLVDSSQGFKMYDFQNSTVEIISPPETRIETLGQPVKGILLSDTLAICYKSRRRSGLSVDMGLLQSIVQSQISNKSLLTWRNPLTFAGFYS